MTTDPGYFPVRVYYEDTDHSGLVYHANYLKYFERAREHWLGIELLLDLARGPGIGFVVYRAEVTYKEGARFGDELTVRTTGTRRGDYRLLLAQDVLRPSSGKVMVLGRLTLVCVDRESKLVPLPEVIQTRIPSIE
ncbi:MAG: YbgC/FadM family acyl-CoA thioesterase [Polyangiaceae bacterium]|nr:YbgC/FadM family acyl-CoA thioesterase [Polyangiaceae bacterium]